MDRLIFDLRCLCRVILATNKTETIMDLFTSDMDTNVQEMKTFRDGRMSLSCLLTKPQDIQQDIVVIDYHHSVTDLLDDIRQNGEIHRITDSQMKQMMDKMVDMMNFLLFSQNQNTIRVSEISRGSCLYMLWCLIKFLLESNKKLDCQIWIKEHSSDLQTLRDRGGYSFLHNAVQTHQSEIVRLFVEECRMDVNVENNYRQTPLHLLCRYLSCLLIAQQKPTQDMERTAELLIENGAHIDAVDVYGTDASRVLSRTFSRWYFNVTLKCLAAKAILKHGIRYEKCVPSLPAEIITIIKTHKPG